ncbi:MAG: response regulator [Anaerocolumna sp.]
MYKLVVVDDEFIVVEGIKAMMARMKLGFEIVGFAYDGIAALEVIRNTRPDIVITDIRIPGMDGLSLIEEAKEFLPNTVFIVISGYNEFEYARRAITLGVKGYIDKPITMEKLTEVLSAAEKEFEGHEQAFHEKQGKLADKQVLNSHIDHLIHGVIQEDVKIVKEQAENILCDIRNQNNTIDEYKNECYKFLCVTLGVFLEQKKQYERENLASYNDIEMLGTYEDINQYVREIINKIAERIEAGKSGSSHRIIIQLLDYIKLNYNKDIGLNELADMVNMNPAYLSVLFKDEVGMSYIKYLTQLRLNHAKELLLAGHKVMEVSEMVGYNDYHYFCNIFKKNTGQKPNEFKGCIRKK